MKKAYLYCSLFVLSTMILSACGGNSTNEIAPMSSETQAIYAKNAALTKALKGDWDTESVMANGRLIYAKSNDKNNLVDYGKFKLKLNAESFMLRDKEGNVVEGIWYVTKGNTLNLDYRQEEYLGCSVSPTCEKLTGNYIVVTISFSLLKEPLSNQLQIQNDKIDYQMTASID